MTDRRVSAAARSAAAVVLFGLSASALGAGYASGVSESGGTVNFILNENNSSVTVIRDGVPTSLGALNLGPQSFARSGAVNYSIVVTSNPGDGFLAAVGAATGITGIRDGTLIGGTFQISDDNNVRYAFNAPRAVAINTNPANGANFGRVYIGNTSNGTTAGFPILIPRSTTDGIYVNDAAGGDPLNQVDTAFTGGVDFGNGTNTSAPWRLALDDDGFVYAADWADATGTLYRLDANISTGTNLFVGQGAAAPLAPSGTLNHGSVAAVFASGSAAAGNLIVYTLDEDLSPTGTADQLNSLWRYNLGSTTAGYSGIPDQLAANILIDDFAAGGIVVEMTRSRDGKFYLSQSRSNGDELGVAVVANDGTTVLYSSLQDSRYLGLDGNPGLDGVQDVLRTITGIEVSPDGRYLAAQRNDSDIFIVPLIDGIPDLPNVLLVDTFDNVISGRNIAFDAANNVYALSSGNQAMRVFSPGGPSETTYNSDGTFRARTEPDFNGSGNYSDTTKWLLGVVPNAGDAYATVGNLSSGAQTLNIDAATAISRLRFAGGNYTVSGGSITMGSGFSEPRVIAEAGNHTINAQLDVQKNLGVAAYTGAELTLTNVTYASNALNLTKFGGGKVTVPGADLNRVDVRGGTLALPSTGTPVLKTKELRLAGTPAAPTSSLDVARGGAILDYNAGSSTIADVQAQIIAGRAGGTWTGSGITSSAAAANSAVTGIGYAEASDLGITNFLGQPVDADAVILRYTRLGDANLDGTTGLGDFSLLGANYNQAGGWSKGDFNYDGTVGLGDFSLLAANYNQTAPASLARPGAVPEPATLSLIGVAALGLVRRRRA